MITLSQFLSTLRQEGIVPSDQQTAAINWVLNGAGSMQLLARAGCGKTFTLMLIVRAIVAAMLGDCALMAYNKKIARELQVKIEQLGINWKTAQAGTVHSFGFSAWKYATGKKFKDGNGEISEGKVANIIEIQALAFTGREEDNIWINKASLLRKLVALGKQKAIGHLSAVDDFSIWRGLWDHFGLDDDCTELDNPTDLIKAAIKVYNISLKQCRDVIDFDDMILAPLYFRARFWPKKWIMVDESQDTNDARRALALAMLAPRVGRMIFVGDDKQAIYGFTGADADSMEQLKKATNATTLPLNVTRRCPKKVVARAQALVPDFVAHEDAPEGETGILSAFSDLYTQNLSHNDVILCRNTAPLVSAAFKFISQNIACRVEGRDIGAGIVKMARRWNVKQLSALTNKLSEHLAKESAKLMSRGQEDKIQGVQDQVECLRIIITKCQSEGIQTVDGLVAKVEGMFGDTPDGEQPKVLTLSTIHKSKGREWKRVYMMDNAKYLPSPYAKLGWQMEQEKNLEYVAITRSMSGLFDVPSPV